MKSKSASTLIKLNLKGEKNKTRTLNSLALVGLASTLTIQIPYNTTAAAASIDSKKTLQSSKLYSNNTISTYKSTGNGVRVRSGAGTSYQILGSVNKNQKLDVISLSNGWYKIKFNGSIGYISASYVGKVTESNNSINSQVISSGKYISTGNGVHIRSGAGTSYQILGSVNKNQRLDVISVSNGWYKINYNGVTGYISSSYVGKVTESNNNNQSVGTGNYISTGNGVRIRSGAGTSHQILGSVNKNQRLDVISLSNGWYKVKYKGTTGYISASYVGKETGSNTSDSNKTDSNKVDSSQTDTNKVDSNNSQSFDVQTLINLSKKYSGVPYIWGGETPSGFDCSGFISYVFKESGMTLPRTNVAGYWYNNSNLKTVDNFQPGDLIFFQNTYTYGPSHMGIVINNNEFIHASSSSGVTISKINNSYWNQHFLGFKRYK
ncbi:C40 family peptidase [Gottfriedia acidiceleris]|uniref:SH3 domain-containing protein n=1 Tax=Gottfriedia acidiceleris TaxID=371036 RepID=A0ABY4JIG6_9BACI|nr:C40 family peptidase [Gottfriedia acidiceleris]UPM53622.1 SH3 domain-containing protein [Gottfriedia acidiceleris]